MQSLAWVHGYKTRGLGPTMRTQRARYSLRALGDRGLLRLDEVNRLLIDADLIDFGWEVVWGDETPTPDDALIDRMRAVDGYVILIHGWTGTAAIWEDMAGQLIARNPRLAVLAVDHNGFGESPFADRTPEYHECSPLAAMRVIERWLEMLKLRRPPGDPTPRVVNFVGHSMGGAALFFLNDQYWRLGEQTRTALAPALLLHDDIGRTFFTALGFGIGLMGRLQFLESIERLVSPRVLDTLTNGAAEAVRAEHARIYAATPRSVTARTLAAMGTIKDHPMPKHWEFMQIFVAHKDVLVGLPPVLELLDELNLDVNQIRVVLGTHYFFSVGEGWERTHAQNRELVIQGILSLHDQALRRQRGT